MQYSLMTGDRFSRDSDSRDSFSRDSASYDTASANSRNCYNLSTRCQDWGGVLRGVAIAAWRRQLRTGKIFILQSARLINRAEDAISWCYCKLPKIEGVCCTVNV